MYVNRNVPDDALKLRHSIVEYWHRISPAIMAYKDKERRVEAVKASLKRIDPELKFVSLKGDLCHAVKEVPHD